MGVDWCPPGYMVREEWQRDRLKSKAELRAWGFERKLEEGHGGGLRSGSVILAGELREGYYLTTPLACLDAPFLYVLTLSRVTPGHRTGGLE